MEDLGTLEQFQDPDDDDYDPQLDLEPDDEDMDGFGAEDEEGEVMCSICGEVYSSQKKLNLHTAKEHEEVELEGHMCTCCGELFPTSRKRNFHMKKGHPDGDTDGGDETPEGEDKKDTDAQPTVRKPKGLYPCKECDRVFNHKNSLSYHLKSHTGLRPYACPTCDKAFYASSALRVNNSS